jgi:D-xylose transport system substrate-binding protein
MFVAMPTAIPDEPLISRFGIRVGRTVGSFSLPLTVYKPLKLIASEAAKLSIQLVRNEKPAYNAQYNNGLKQVSTLLLKPIPLTKANVQTLVDDGFYTKAQLSAN